jgi:branched-chain amino acid transport system permease protein
VFSFFFSFVPVVWQLDINNRWRIAMAHRSIIVLAILVCFAFLLLRGHYFLSSLVLAGIYAISVLGIVLLVGLSGQYSLGHAAFFGIGAYSSALLTRNGIHPVVALAVSVVFTSAVAAAVAIPLARLQGYVLSVATLAFGLVVFSILNGWRAVTLGPSGITDIPPISVFGFAFKGEIPNYWLIWIVALLSLWGAFNLWRSRAGQAMLAVKRDEAAAAAMGINVAYVKVQIFVLSAALAAVAGCFYASYVSFIAPERFGMIASFELLLAALLGGIGTPVGAVVGALLLVALPEIVAPLRDFKIIFYGIVFISVSLYFPQGIAGVVGQAALRARGRRMQQLVDDSTRERVESTVEPVNS